MVPASGMDTVPAASSWYSPESLSSPKTISRILSPGAKRSWTADFPADLLPLDGAPPACSAAPVSAAFWSTAQALSRRPSASNATAREQKLITHPFSCLAIAPCGPLQYHECEGIPQVFTAPANRHLAAKISSASSVH